MLPQRKHVPNGIISSSLPMDKKENGHSLLAGRRHDRSLIPGSIAEQANMVYSHPYKRNRHQSSSLAHRQSRGDRHNRKANGDSGHQACRLYESNRVKVPEPDYSLTDTESASDSIRLRGPSFWANSADYHHRGAGDDHDRRDRPNNRESALPDHAISTAQRSRHSIASHRWTNDAESIPNIPNHYFSQHTLPTRKSRAITSDHRHPHVTTITLTDSAGSLNRVNGDPFGTSHRRDNALVEQGQRHDYRTDAEQWNHDVRSPQSPRIETVLPSTFSNVNLLKRVNDRYKLTERLLLQLKIIAVLHTFFGFAMFSLDTAQTAVLWSYIDDVNERLYLCLRTLYSLGVILIGCLSIAISCGKRSVLLELVKILCIVFLATLLAAPAQTPFFKSITDTIQYNDLVNRHHTTATVTGEQHPQRKRMADPEDRVISMPSFFDSINHKATLSYVHSSDYQATSRKRPTTTANTIPRSDLDIDENNDEGRSIERETRLLISSTDNEKLNPSLTATHDDQRRLRALRIAQHLRIAYTIFTCCHFLSAIATLAVVLRLDRLS